MLPALENDHRCDSTQVLLQTHDAASAAACGSSQLMKRDAFVESHAVSCVVRDHTPAKFAAASWQCELALPSMLFNVRPSLQVVACAICTHAMVKSRRCTNKHQQIFALFVDTTSKAGLLLQLHFSTTKDEASLRRCRRSGWQCVRRCG